MRDVEAAARLEVRVTERGASAARLRKAGLGTSRWSKSEGSQSESFKPAALKL
jgi:hypothetical protein